MTTDLFPCDECSEKNISEFEQEIKEEWYCIGYEQGKEEGLKVIKDAWNDWNKHHINYIEFIAILKKELGDEK